MNPSPPGFHAKGGNPNASCNLAVGDVFLGDRSDGALFPVHESMRKNLEVEERNADLSHSGDGDFPVRLLVRGADPARVVLIKRS
jgi:hypothetical protein